MSIPFIQIGISSVTQEKLQSSDVTGKMQLAQGQGCTSDEEALSVLMILSQDPDPSVSALAKGSFASWDERRLGLALTRQTHGKVLEFVVQFLPAVDRVDEYIFQSANLNERTAKLIAQRVGKESCDHIANTRQTFLLYPVVFWSLKSNPNCPAVTIERLEAMLKQQQAFVEAPKTVQAVRKRPKLPIDNILMEVMAAVQSRPSPALQQALSSQLFLSAPVGGSNGGTVERFEFTFDADDTFDFDASLIDDGDGEEAEDENLSLEKRIREMPVGKRIKLAYKGNKEARSILIRDTNKSVSVAVLKSGKVNAGEAAVYAANRNLSEEVIRTICATKEFMRKQNVRMALVGNPKTPTKVAMGILMSLGKKDLQALAKNRSVSGTISKAALKRFKTEFQR